MALIKPVKFVDFIFKMFFYLGITPSGSASLAYKIYGTLIFSVFFAAYDVLLVMEVVSSRSFNEMVYSGACAIGMMVVGARHLTLFVFSGNVHFLTNELLEHFTDDETLLQNINNILRRFNAFAHTFFFIVLATVTTLFFLPIFSSTKMLPYKIWFPFDTNSNVILLISSNTYAVICMCFFAISILSSLLIWYMLLNVSIRYEILGSDLKYLNKIQHNDRQKESNCMQLVGLIRKHLQIYYAIQTIRRTFHALFTFQLITSGVGICCVLYVLVFASKSNFTDILIYGVLFGYLVFEILAIMYLGNEITLTSSKLYYHLYESNWIGQSKMYKELVLIFMEFLKQPERIVILKLFPLSLELFTSIMRISYSSFNILRTFAE